MKTPADLNISPKHQLQLARAKNRASTQFYDKIIIPSFLAAVSGFADGYPHLFYGAEGSFSDLQMDEIIECSITLDGENDWPVVIEATELFTNPLGVAGYDPSRKVAGKASGWTPPNQRVVNGSWLVCTFEFDGDDTADLEMQLDWFAGKPENCPFNAVHKSLSLRTLTIEATAQFSPAAKVSTSIRSGISGTYQRN